jgi:predicted transposase YdaD
MKNKIQQQLTRRLRISRIGEPGRRFRIRRNYKDRLFIQLFHERTVLLELYNALNGSAYDDADELIITTIGDAIYLGMKNDCSFIIGNYLNLYEHQSTFCPNMPIRGLIYIVDIYQAYIAVMDLNLYGTTQIKLPTPKYVVFYNGEEKHDDVEYLRLSDAFTGEGSCLEFTATMYNINQGHNQKLMEQCDTLQGYSFLVMKIREFQAQGMTLEEATDEACQYCIEHDILRNFLLKNRNEVRNVLLTEYNAKHQRKLDRRDARAEGRTEGLNEGLSRGLSRGRSEERAESIERLLHKGKSPEEIHELLDYPMEEILRVEREARSAVK